MPLTGVKVVDLTRVVSGPFCTMLLADMGADVIKIEKPGEGDPVRQQGAIRNGFSWYFAAHNRNKRSLTLDLYGEEGKEVLSRLLTGADILVENYRPGTLERMGFGEERLRQLNPGLVVCGINGFGSTGPYVDRPAFDFIALCDRFPAILLGEVPNLSARRRAARIARGTEDGVERVVAGDRQLPELSVLDDSVRRFIALVDECYDRRVPLYIEAEVALDELYTQGYLAFAFRRTLSRLHEMQLQRFGAN